MKKALMINEKDSFFTATGKLVIRGAVKYGAVQLAAQATTIGVKKYLKYKDSKRKDNWV